MYCLCPGDFALYGDMSDRFMRPAAGRDNIKSPTASTRTVSRLAVPLGICGMAASHKHLCPNQIGR